MDSEVSIQLILMLVFNTIFAVCGIFLNTLVVVSFGVSSHLRKKLSNFMIMVLSMLDLIAIVVKSPIITVYLISWLNEEYDLLKKIDIYNHFGNIFVGNSLVALIVMNVERYFGVCYPFFHHTSVTRSRLLTLLVILSIVHAAIVMFSTNDFLITFPMGVAIFMVILFPPLLFINYKLFWISRKRRRNAVSPDARLKVNLKSISTCLLAVACLLLLSIPLIFYTALGLAKTSTSNSTKLGFYWSGIAVAMNSTFNSLIFFWKNKALRTEATRVLKTLKDRLSPLR